MTGILIVIGYVLYAVAGAFILANVVCAYLTLQTGRFHSAVFVVASLCAFIGCQFLGMTPHGCNLWTVVLFVVLDCTAPFLADWFFKLIGLGPDP